MAARAGNREVVNRMVRQATDAPRDALDEGRESYRRRAWEEAYQSLSLAEQTTALDVEDVERLATAAYLTGRDDDFQRLIDRAHQAHLGADKPERAARSAFWLSLTLHLRGEVGHANAW